MRFGRNLKEVDKILSKQFPNHEIFVQEHRMERSDPYSDYGFSPKTTITITLSVFQKSKKPSLLERIKSYFK